MTFWCAAGDLRDTSVGLCTSLGKLRTYEGPFILFRLKCDVVPTCTSIFRWDIPVLLSQTYIYIYIYIYIFKMSIPHACISFYMTGDLEQVWWLNWKAESFNLKICKILLCMTVFWNIYIFIYLYIYVCVCVCVSVSDTNAGKKRFDTKQRQMLLSIA
jgi:hypothetical protein